MKIDENKRKVLDAIKKQRWYFFYNNDNIILDRETGYLWANLDKFPYSKRGLFYTKGEIDSVIRKNNFGGIGGFRVPDAEEFWYMIKDKTFPFQEGKYYRILDKVRWYVKYALKSRNATPKIRKA